MFFAALLLPRAADSRFLPLPVLDHAELRQIDRMELARFVLPTGGAPGALSAQGARSQELSVGVRTVGELFRRSGLLLWEGSPGAEASLRDLRSQFRELALRGETEELLALRSLQSQLFVRALEREGEADTGDRELEELGGDLVHLLARGWLGGIGAHGGGVDIEPSTLRLLFRVRWGLLVGCHRQVPFGPSLEEQRAYYSLYLQHPPLALGDEVAQALERVRYATALGQVDQHFPGDFAVGSLLLQAREPELAAVHLRAHLARSEDGPFGQLARNHLLFAMSPP